MIKLRKIVLAIVFTAACFILTGCQFALLNPQGLIAIEEKKILVLSAGLMLIVVIPVVLMTLLFAWRYRESNTQATYRPNWSHNTPLEVIWWSVPCIIIGILSTVTWFSSHKLDPYKPILKNDSHPMTIQAIALRWKWLFVYPEQNIATINYVQFPVNTPIKFVITSEGPMNSFLIPQLAGQIYAMSGMQTKLHILANATGDFDGISANFSGEGFSNMKFIAHVSTTDEFTHWVTTIKQSAEPLTFRQYIQLEKPSMNNPVQYYSSTPSDIFTAVVMKYMNPARDGNPLCNQNLNVIS